jgi:hypothetical protein
MLDILPTVAFSMFFWCGFVLSTLRSRRRLATIAVCLVFGVVGRVVAIVILQWLLPRSAEHFEYLVGYFSILVAITAMWCHAQRTREPETSAVRS